MTRRPVKNLRHMGRVVAEESPVERIRKELPQGDARWDGWEYVSRQISLACERMAQAPGIHLSDEHVTAMAILGCGHEETMKAEMWRLRDRGFISLQESGKGGSNA